LLLQAQVSDTVRVYQLKIKLAIGEGPAPMARVDSRRPATRIL